VIAASNGQNLLLAERFAVAARKKAQRTEGLNLIATPPANAPATAPSRPVWRMISEPGGPGR
jgi:hypothetical protein